MKELIVNKNIYSNKSLRAAITAYSGYASITIQDHAKTCSLFFTDCRYDEERTIKEFENYLIGLENM